MNRRNFLKLFGLGLVPASLLSTPAQAKYVTDIRHVRIKTRFGYEFRVTIDNSAEPALADFDGIFGDDWVKLDYRDQNNNRYVPIHSQFFEVSEKSVITITSPTGNTVTFSPQVDLIYGNFMKQVDIDFVGVELTALQESHRLS